jgi:transketolase
MESMFRSFVEKELTSLQTIAKTVRGLCMDTVLQSNSGHIGLPLGGAEIMTLLYFGVLKHDPQDPKWIDRDRFILSAGHGSALLYTSLHLSGYDLGMDELKRFRQLGSKTPGHPEYGHTSGVECTTGPLGQGIAMAVGMALAEAHLRNSGPEGHFTYALVGDGCLMEGVSYEAMSLAGHLGLNRLIALYDDNSITIDGKTDIAFSENVTERCKASGWNVLHADGHDFLSLARALDEAHRLAAPDTKLESQRPTIIICKTIAGKGLSRWQGQPKVHGNPHTADDVAEAKRSIGLDPNQSFFVPNEVTATCQRLVKERARANTTKKTSQPEAPRFQFSPSQLAAAKGAGATRAFSGAALKALFETHHNLMGGSADLAGSNNTTLAQSGFISRGNFSGNNIHFGVREHAMAAISNGLALHGGIRPYCATFAVFSDYMRPAIRLAAIMKLGTVFILTHDSYAVGEDGPTHQPIEHAAALRAIPGLRVLRPADGLETFAAWQAAITNTDQPTALLLTRQKVDDIDDILKNQGLPPRSFSDIARAAQDGGMIIRESKVASSSQKLIKVTLLASGSEVADTLKAAALLESNARGLLDANGNPVTLAVRVSSVMGIKELLRNQQLLNVIAPPTDSLFAVEAGSPDSFAAAVGRSGHVFGIDRFGESAPAEVLKAYFKLTPEDIAARVTEKLQLSKNS